MNSWEHVDDIVSPTQIFHFLTTKFPILYVWYASHQKNHSCKYLHLRKTVSMILPFLERKNLDGFSRKTDRFYKLVNKSRKLQTFQFSDTKPHRVWDGIFCIPKKVKLWHKNEWKYPHRVIENITEYFWTSIIVVYASESYVQFPFNSVPHTHTHIVHLGIY